MCRGQLTCIEDIEHWGHRAVTDRVYLILILTIHM